MGLLDGRVAFITGAARGQGRSHAIRLAEEGADIIGVDALVDYDTIAYGMGTQDDLDETVSLVEKLDRRMLGIVADVRDRTALTNAVTAGIAEFGRLDIACVNAGISPPGGPLWTLSSQEWDDVIAVNLSGAFNPLAAVVPAILEAGNGGSIIVTSSGAGLKTFQNLSDYNASKFGVIGLARTLANELAAQNIRVNTICPGTVGTPMVTANETQFPLFRPDLENPTLEDCIPAFASMMPMGQPWVDPQDISNAVLFLASDMSRYITGVVLPVDQGSNNRA
jgi:SDR family mycofactocin-dependent oxidoreductase